MSTLTIRERIQALQRWLGVSPDGLVGPVTLSRLEEALARCLGTGSLQLEQSRAQLPQLS